MKAVYTIVGMQHRGSEALVASLPIGEPLQLIRDPFNDHDMNAIEVWARGQHVGFIKAIEAKLMADWMDKGGTVELAARYVNVGRWPQAEVTT